MVKRLCVDTAAYLFLPGCAAPEPGDQFVDESNPLSNTFACRITDPKSGREYPSLEHFLQARKIAFHVAYLKSQASYAEPWEQLAESLASGAADLDLVKMQTCKTNMIHDEREQEAWAYESHMLILQGWRLKFAQNPECRARLLATGSGRLFFRTSRRGGVEHWTGLERVREGL